MKGGKLKWIVAGVVVFHLVIFALIYNKRVLPERRYIPPPNFKGAELSVVDDATGETVTHKRFKVTTELGDEN